MIVTPLRTTRARPWWRWLATILALLIGAALAALSAYVWRATPQHSGTLKLSGAPASLVIERDAAGIPTIKANSLRDAAYGLGVVHAQDRLWQLETHRRIGAGRLAEAFGESALPNDKFLRSLGVRRTAALQFEQAGPESKDFLLAYAAGINAHLRQAHQARPPEMMILGIQPEDWSPIDSLAWATMMAWDLGGNWNAELLRLRLAVTLGMSSERIHQLMPPYPGDAPLITADFASQYRALGLMAAKPTAHDGKASGSSPSMAQLDAIAEAAPPSGIEGMGSNNWVVAGSHSATGSPLLANDPHLKLSAPALWYLARIEVPGLQVAGATMPGLPLVVLGQNQHLAWGFTNTGPDVQDLYVERIDPQDASQYLTPGGPASFETIPEVIKVKSKPDVHHLARRTRHGPVISDAGGASQEALGDQKQWVLAMRWTALEPDVDPIAVGLGLMRAASARDFIQAAQHWVAPMQNMVVADKSGAIGMVSAGRVPLRSANNDLQGLTPAPGWLPQYDWQGWLPVDATPRELNPTQGWIATANQRIHPSTYPHFITSEWAAPYRQQRIEQLLRAKPKHSLDDLSRMQADVHSLAVAPLLPWLNKVSSKHPLAAAATAALKDFDGQMAADAAAPLIFSAWVRQLTLGVFEDDVGPALLERTLQNRAFRDALEGVLTRRDGTWCDDQRTTTNETCEQQSSLAFDRALDELQARLGADVNTWRWGQVHQARSEHRPFSRVKPLAPWFELRTPTGGDTFTVNVGRVGLRADPTSGEFYLNEHGPSLRALYDVVEPSQSRMIHSSGQSGLPWERHYRDWVKPWAEGQSQALWFKPEAITHRLTIKP